MEDTPEVAAAKASFKAAFDVAQAGDHIDLAPVNNDVQAAQIANAYLDDTAEVADAKAAFDAVFKNVAAGGLADMQEPAPVHEVPEPVVMKAAPAVAAPAVSVPVYTYHHPTVFNTAYAYHHPTVYNTAYPHVYSYPFAAFNYA